MTIIGDAGRSQRELSYKNQILKIVADKRLNDRIRFLGFLPYPKFLEEIKNHDIFLAPSIHSSDGETEGGAPVTLIEVSAYGLPIVSTYHCDIPEIVIDGQTGYLVPEKDVDGLIDRIEYLVRHPELWEKMGRLARKHVEENYEAKKQTKKLEMIYKSLIG